MELIKTLEPGSVIAVVIADSQVYFDADSFHIKIGTISIEDYSWGEDIKPVDGKCSAVALTIDSDGYIVFGVKHLSPLEHYVENLPDYRVLEIVSEWSEQKRVIERLKRQLYAQAED